MLLALLAKFDEDFSTYARVCKELRVEILHMVHVHRKAFEAGRSRWRQGRMAYPLCIVAVHTYIHRHVYVYAYIYIYIYIFIYIHICMMLIYAY